MNKIENWQDTNTFHHGEFWDLLKLVEVSPSIPEIGIEGDGAVEPSACKP